MAKLVDPDSFTAAVNTTATTQEVEIQTGTKTVELRVAGNLSDAAPGKTSGATAKAVYSFLKEEWLANATLRRFKFPLKMIFEGSFIWVNGWAPKNQQTRDLFRDAGFYEQVAARTNSCMVSLGAIHNPASDLAYYTQAPGFTQIPTNYDKTGELNENINATGTSYAKTFMRIQGKRYAEYNLLAEQGLSVITYQAYSFPLSNSTDLKITVTDNDIDTLAPYTGMKVNYLKGVGFTTWANSTVYPASAVVKDNITGRWKFTVAGGTSSGTSTANDVGCTWVAYDGEEQIGAFYYAFNRVVTCNGGTDVQAYNFMQRQLRKASDINANDTPTLSQRGFGIVNGNVATLLAEYVGDNLKPKPGVLLRGFDTNSTNNIQHSPITVDGGGLDSESVPLSSSEVPFPFVAAGSFNFSSNLVSQPDAQTVYTVYFEYITRSSGSATLTVVSGATGNLSWTGTLLDHIQTGDYILISGFSTNPTNNGLYYVNSTGVDTANVTHQKGSTLVTETAALVVDENPFESPGAVIVNKNVGGAMDGQITAASISWDFDYTNNNQGGRTPNTPAPIHIVAQALDGAEWTEATHTITAATGQSIPVNAGDERNYANPA
jgi:hypothetical protein